jgi:hypothetical protein
VWSAVTVNAFSKILDAGLVPPPMLSGAKRRLRRKMPVFLMNVSRSRMSVAQTVDMEF